MVGKAAHHSHIDEVVTEEATVYVDGVLSLAFFPMAPSELLQLLWAFRTSHYATSFRTLGLSTRSATIGFAPRVAFHRDFCSVCQMSYKQPDQHNVFLKFARHAAARYRTVNPGKYAEQEEKLSGVLPQWRISETPFTSGIINKDNQLAYHRDQGNFKDCWSCMYAAAENCDGGLLAVPEIGLGFSFRQPALIMFDGAALLHGVTPIKHKSPLAHRYSCVFYALQGMGLCKTSEEELVRIRRIKTLREKDRARSIPPLWAQHETGKVVLSKKVALVYDGPGDDVGGLYSDAYRALVADSIHVDIIKLSNSEARQRSLSFPVPRLYGDNGKNRLAHMMFSEHPVHLAKTLMELNRYDVVVLPADASPEVRAGITVRILPPEAVAIGDDPSKLKEIL